MIKMKKFGKLLIIFLTVFLGIKAFAFINFPKAVLTVDKTDITVGDSVSAEVKISVPSFVKLLQTEDDFSVDGWDVQSFSFKQNMTTEGEYILNMKITTFDSKIREIPQIKFSYVNADETNGDFPDKFYFFSNSMPVNVKSMFQNEAFETIRDVKQIKILSIPLAYYVMAVFFILFAVIIYKDVLSVKILKETNVDTFTPKETAVRKLNVLFDDKNFSDEKIGEYYCRLSDILKDFIVKSLNLTKSEMTTTELLALIKDENNLFNKDYNEISYLFKTYDNLKYSNCGFDKANFFENFKRTKELVEK